MRDHSPCMSQPFEHAPPVLRGHFRTDELSRALYAESAGILRVEPRAIAVAADVDDVRALVRWAASLGVPLIPRGSGSSMAGGAVGDGVVVDLSRLTTLSPVDNVRRTVWGGAGVTRRRVEHAANAEGLRLPVDPSSGAFATIGGMTATNAAGPHTHGLRCDASLGRGGRLRLLRRESRDDPPRRGASAQRSGTRSLVGDGGVASPRGIAGGRARGAQGIVGLRRGGLRGERRARRPAGGERGDAGALHRGGAPPGADARRHGERPGSVGVARSGGRWSGTGPRGGGGSLRAARSYLPRRGA